MKGEPSPPGSGCHRDWPSHRDCGPPPWLSDQDRQHSGISPLHVRLYNHKAVLRPKSGSQTLTSLKMSSGWLAPISMTAISVSSPIERSDRGIPMSLLRLPFVAATLYFAERTLVISSLVVVLPLVPVRPTTVILFPPTKLFSL